MPESGTAHEDAIRNTVEDLKSKTNRISTFFATLDDVDIAILNAHLLKFYPSRKKRHTADEKLRLVRDVRAKRIDKHFAASFCGVNVRTLNRWLIEFKDEE